MNGRLKWHKIIDQKINNMFKNLSGETVAIIILSICLVVAIILGQRKPNIDTHADEIANLNKSNAALLRKNDSINAVNVSITNKLTADSIEYKTLAVNLTNTKLQLDKLNKSKNETSNNINHLSSNGLASAFSNYLQNRPKSKVIY